jgi:signal transduction histidine kinase
MRPVPALIARRAWWLALLLAWAAVVGVSLRFHLADLHRQSLDVATEGARNMFRMVVLVRAWNAEHGGVYVPVGPRVQPNPYLEHPRRDLTTTDGQALTMVNPAFMTRLLAEMAQADGGTVFHITSLKPIRPKNAPDDWERKALESFEQGSRELVEVVGSDTGEQQLRYMAPLWVTKPCLSCHEKQGYRLGDIRGGISVSQPFAPVAAASLAGQRQAYGVYGGVFLLVAVAGGWLLELLRRRWIGLTDNLAALEHARGQLEQTNRSLAQARDAAESASRAKSAFLSNMSHELRTPLNAVIGFTHLLRMDDADGHHQEMLEHIDVASQQLLAMIDEVLDLSRLESGELVLAPVDFDLDDLLGALFASLDAAAAPKGLGCRLERDPALPDRLHGDPQRIGQLLGHYIANAVKFSERGEIVLRALLVDRSASDVCLRLEVRDQGVGISGEHQARLFRPFEQADMSATRRFAGAGLGLAVCRRLAELMGGEVGVDSAPDRGSRFWFQATLPVGAAGDGPAALLDTGPGTDGDAAAGILERFSQLLAEDDMEAAALWREHTALLRGVLGDQAAEVEQEVGAFRFNTALAAVRRAAQR